LNPDGRESVGNRSNTTAYPVILAPQVREIPATEVLNNAWISGPVSLQRNQNSEFAHQAASNTDDTTMLRRQEVWSPVWNTPDMTRAGQAPLQGTLIFRGTDKDVAQDYMNPASTSRGFTGRDGVDAPPATMKDTLDVSGIAGTYGITSDMPARGAYEQSTVDAPLTMKALNSDTEYLAPGIRNRGFGIRQHGIQDWTTLKETLLTDHFGPAQSIVQRNATRDAAWEDSTDRTQETKYSMPVNIIREEGMNRCAEVQLKQEYNAARTEHGMVPSAQIFACEEVALKDERNVNTRMYGNIKANQTDRAGIGLTNRVVVDNTAINSRLDPSTVVTSDLYPFLNKQT
jgi:hypothetical protein